MKRVLSLLTDGEAGQRSPDATAAGFDAALAANFGEVPPFHFIAPLHS